MRQYLTQRKAAMLAALVVVTLMTGYEAGAMKCASQADPAKLPPAVGSYEIGSSAILAPSDGGIIANFPASAAPRDRQVGQSKQAANAGSAVQAVRKMVCRHPHHVHKLPNQQDFDFGYVFGGSGLD
jgi:hypothetical protein